MLQHPESSAGQSGQDEVAEDGNSDSGDSLFITQIPTAERSKRRRRLIPSLDPTSGEETVNEDLISPISDDDGESDRDREKKKKERFRLPNPCFTFLSEKGRKLKSQAEQKPTKLWENHQRGEDLVTSLPTIDMVGVHIPPISEEEEEGFEDKDIKVVEKKHFVVPSKAKHSKTWCTSKKRHFVFRQQRRRPSVSGSESQIRQSERADKDWMWRTALIPDRRRYDDVSSADEVVQEGGTHDNENVDARPEWQNTGGTLKQAKKVFNQEENEKEASSNSGAHIGETSPEKSEERRENGPAADVGHREHEPESQNHLLGDDDASCRETRVKKRKKKENDKGVEEGRDLSREEVKGQDAEASASVGITEVEEAPSLPPAVAEPAESKRKKKKRKKNKSATEDVRQDVDGCTDGMVEEDSVVNAENGGKKKKKRNSDQVDVEGSNTNAPAEQLTDGAKVSKKKRKKELNDSLDLPQILTEHLETGSCLENTFVSEKTLEFSRAQRKKHKKKKDKSDIEGRCADVDFTNKGPNLSGSTGLSVKRKKSISETCVDVSHTPEEDESAADAQKTTKALEEQDAEMVTKKKKKKLCTNLTETLRDYSVSAWKKTKKTSSFLVADEEEKASQTRRGKYSDSQSVAEKPTVSEGLAAKAAEITGSLGESGKKKRKRSAREENVEGRETEFEEPKETGQVLPETGVRKKKKRKRNESEPISGAERLERAADVEAVVLRKKKKKKKSKLKIPPAAAEAPETEKSALSSCATTSAKKKGKQGYSCEISHQSSCCDEQVARGSLVQDTGSDKALGENKKKKKKRKQLINMSSK